MSRPTTGIITTEQATALNIKELRAAGLLIHGQLIKATVKHLRYEMQIEADFRGTLPFIRLMYSYNGTPQDYIINIEVRASNLHKGEIMNFICPASYRRCRCLYLSYGSPVFKARQAYRTRIYYASQLAGGRSRGSTRYWQIDRQLNKLYEGQQYFTFKGQPTRLANRIDRLEEKKAHYEGLMDQSLLHTLNKLGYFLR